MEENIPPIYPQSSPRSSHAFQTKTNTGRKSRGWMIFVIIFIAYIGYRYFIQVFGNQGYNYSGAYQEIIVENENSDAKFLIIDVEGIISGDIVDGASHSMVTRIKDQLKLAASDPAIIAVILKVDSPGGEVLAADDLHKAIKHFYKSTRKPVIATFASLAASGGYYVSAPCQWIVANELTITGSIGVIMQGLNYRGLMEKLGLQPQVYKSGPYKDMLSGNKSPDDISPEEKRMAQGIIDQTYKKFTNIVFTGRMQANIDNLGRGQKMGSNWTNFVDGRIFSGVDAFKNGFVDELGDFETARDRAKKMTGIATANMIRYEEPFNLASYFRWFLKSYTGNIKVELSAGQPRLKSGRIYLLPPMLWQ